MSERIVVSVYFDDAAAADCFVGWMSNAGEQDFDEQVKIDRVPRQTMPAYDYEKRTIEYETLDEDDDTDEQEANSAQYEEIDDEDDPFAYTLMNT